MVIHDLVRECEKNLSDNARFEAEQIVMSALGLTRTDLITRGREEADNDAVNAAREMVSRRVSGEPLQYILGECEFMSLPFYTERNVLIPRSDTETLVEQIIKSAEPDAEILDICCGTGCIGISLAHFLNGARVTLLDISEKAVALAQRNIALNGVKNVTVKRFDILTEIPCGRYDIIVSNPPYIETAVIGTLQREVKDFEPHLALDGGSDGLVFYRRITEIAPQMLNENGILAFEIGFNQGDSVKELMEKNFTEVKIIKDLTGNDRVVTGRKRK